MPLKAARWTGIQKWLFFTQSPYTDSDDGRSYFVAGGINLPISDYWGASIDARIGHYSEEIDADQYDLVGTVFLRNLDLGKIGASYGYTRFEFDFPASSTISDTVNTDTYKILGEYYLSDFTLGLSRSRIKFSTTPQDANTSLVSALWYVTDNTRVKLAAGGMDAEDVYFYEISYQPSYFDNAISFSLWYDDSKTGDSISLSFNYYFDVKVSLKERDRKYH